MRLMTASTCAAAGGVLITAAALAAPADDEPVSVPASFNPLPDMWGLRPLAEGTRLDDLDASFVLYVKERARLPVGDADGVVHFAEGRLLAARGSADVRDLLDAHGCVCALEYDDASPGAVLHVPAGAYRLAQPPDVTVEGSGVVRAVFTLSAAGQSDRVKLRRLVCGNAVDDTVTPLAGALPHFAILMRKQHAGFADPPIDDRPVLLYEIAQRSADPRVLALSPEELGLAPRDDAARDRRASPSFEALDTRTARPGLFTLLEEIGSGRKLRVDHSDYFHDFDPYFSRLDRSQGIYFRTPGSWP